MQNNRILVAGIDKATNHEFSRYLQQLTGALVQSDNEFQKAIETGDKYRWLSLFVGMEDVYAQTLIVLWYGQDTILKRGKQVSDNMRENIIQFANEVVFEPYSNKKMKIGKTKVFFVNLLARIRYNEIVPHVLGSIENASVPGFQTKSANFAWNFPYDLMELYPS